MLLSAIIAVVIYALVRYLCQRYWGTTPVTTWLPIGGVVIYALGIVTYPVIFEGSFRAAFPNVGAAQPAAGPVAATTSATPSTAKIVACPAKPVLGTESAPGAIDAVGVGTATPQKVAGAIDAARGDTVHLWGWIVLPSGPATQICVLVDGKFVAAQTLYGSERDDVAAAMGKPADAASGYVIALPLHVPPGKHIVSLGAVNADGTTVSPISAAPVQFTVR